jgi:hypothetical protein
VSPPSVHQMVLDRHLPATRPRMRSALTVSGVGP